MVTVEKQDPETYDWVYNDPIHKRVSDELESTITQLERIRYQQWSEDMCHNWSWEMREEPPREEDGE